MNLNRLPRRQAKLRMQYRAIAAYLGLDVRAGRRGDAHPVVHSALLAGRTLRRHSFPAAGPPPADRREASAYFRLKPQEAVLSLQDGGLIVVLSWLGVCLISTWPLMAIEDLNFTQAIFESVSGWTTTGLSVVDVTEALQDHALMAEHHAGGRRGRVWRSSCSRPSPAPSARD